MATPEELQKLRRVPVIPKVKPLIPGGPAVAQPFAERKVAPLISGENTASATPLGLPSIKPAERPTAAPALTADPGAPSLRSESAPKGMEGMRELGNRISEGFKQWNRAEGTPYEQKGMTPRMPEGPRVAGLGGMPGVPSTEAPIPGKAPIVGPMGRVATVATPAGVAEKLTSPDGTTTATLEGGSMSGIDRPGGSFRVQAGEASSQPGYAQMTNEQKIAANVAAIKAQAPKATAAQPQREGSRVQTIHNPSMQEAMQDYAAGRVGSEGYKMIRNLKMKEKQAALESKREALRVAGRMPGGRYRKMAMRDIATSGADTKGFDPTAFAGTDEDVGEELSFADKMRATQLQMTQDRNVREAARDQRQDEAAEEQINYTRKRDQAKDVDSLRELGLGELDRMTEAGEIAPELSQGFREMAFEGEDPFRLRQHLVAIQKKNPNLAKAMQANDPKIRSQAAAKILAAIQAERGASQ